MEWTQCPIAPMHPRDAGGALTSVATGTRCGGNCYYACTTPEAPHQTGRTCYDARCRKCMIAAQAAVLAGNADETGFNDFDEVPLGIWLLEAIASWQ